MAGSQWISSFFNTRLQLLEDVIVTLSGGQPANWEKLCISLFKIGVKITGSTITRIEQCHSYSARARAEEAWSIITGYNITVDMLTIALEDAGLIRLSDAVKVALFGGSAMANIATFDPNPGVRMNIGSINAGGSVTIAPTAPTMALRLTDMVAASKKRIGDPLDKLEDDACLVVKVSCVNVTDDSKLADLDFEICGAYKGLAAAKREANLRLDEEIQAAGGDETRVCNMYTVWPFRAYASAARREVRDRTRDAGQKASAAASK
jgi:hypothetical protein